MKEQIEEKLAAGFNCIKLKIGAIDFQKELELLAFIRSHFSPEEIEIRVDANGAFALNEALDKLNQLNKFQLHSIEQPIKKGNIQAMADLCKITTFPIALDEELIGIFSFEEKEKLLQEIMPQYIILKPSFIGGFRGTLEWITLAEKYNIGWWITSALESNIGLNAIAQWTYTLNSKMPQGLGTGALYTNNFDCPLEVSKGQLWYSESQKCDSEILKKVQNNKGTTFEPLPLCTFEPFFTLFLQEGFPANLLIPAIFLQKLTKLVLPMCWDYE